MRVHVYLLLALVPLTACKKKEDEGAAKRVAAAPVKVDLVTADLGPSPEVFVLTGTVIANQRSEVTADTQGKVIDVMVERGKRVKAGDPVVRLDVQSAALSSQEAQANLQAARAQKSLADEECKRTQTLLDKGAITRSEYDRQNAACTSAQQSVSAAQARAAMMAKSYRDGIVRAPFSGVVDMKNVAVGEWVAPGRALFTLVDDDPLKIELSVPEVDVYKIKEGQRVELFAVSRPGTSYWATITRIGAEIGRSRALIVEATIDSRSEAMGGGDHAGSAGGAGGNAPRGIDRGANLVPGTFCEAHVVIDTVQRVVLPATAAPLHGKTFHAFVVKKGELQERLVQLGPEPERGKVSVIQGVAKGEKVVAKVTAQIVDGLRVVE
jgi:membrane fusion protein (multidrug efflux system)